MKRNTDSKRGSNLDKLIRPKNNRSKSDKYKGVFFVNGGQANVTKKWIGRYNRRSAKTFLTEKEAAKWYDLQCIRDGKEPQNGFYKKIGTRGKKE